MLPCYQGFWASDLQYLTWIFHVSKILWFFIFFQTKFTSFTIWLFKAWNCWSINAMIRDESSGYGWGNGMMFVKGNAGASMGKLLVQLIRCNGNPPAANRQRGPRWRMDQYAKRKMHFLEIAFINLFIPGEYRFLTDGHFSWPEARTRCHKLGGFLAEFESFFEHSVVTTVIDLCRWFEVNSLFCFLEL